MTALSSLDARGLRHRLGSEGLAFRAGPFAFRIRSRFEKVTAGIARLYADYPLVATGEFVDFDIRLARGAGLRTWLRPQVRFFHDGESPFDPLPAGHALPLLEWAMNWCIATQAHQYLMLHAAVVERGGRAALLPAPPGSGKSTLCAALTLRGWRLLSDEIALVALDAGGFVPLCRPVSLKNESLGLVRAYAPQSVFSEVTHDTQKGSVAHLKVARAHLARAGEAARPRWIVFPKYVAGAPPRLAPRSRADSLLELGRNAFNYTLLGRAGFEGLSALVSTSDCHDFSYSRLDDAVAAFDALAAAS